MKKKQEKIKQLLQQAIQDKGILRLYLKGEEGSHLEGFVYAVSDTLAATNTVSDCIHQDSFCVIRLQDIKEVKVSPRQAFYKKVFQLRGEKRLSCPSLDLTSMQTAIQDIVRLALIPLLVIRIRDDDDVCWIGQVTECTNDTLQLCEVDTDGAYDETRSYQLADIPYVNFDGPYEEALWLVNKASNAE